MKNSFVMGCSLHDAKVPVKTIMDESNSMAIEIPSTPIDRVMFNGSYQLHDAVYNMAAFSPALRNAMKSTVRYMESMSNMDDPVTMTARVWINLRHPHNAASIAIGIITNRRSIFIVSFLF
jgi:hypothetical protein